MRNVGRFRRLSFVLGTVVVLVAALVGTQIATAYRRQPQSGDELAGLNDATRALIEEEPW